MLTKFFFRFIFLLILLFISSINTLECYDCDNCFDIPTCKCDKVTTVSNSDYYCILTRETIFDASNLYIKPITRNFTVFYAYEPVYISVEETISYNKTSRSWISQSNTITYGCQSDRCNRADLLKDLPINGLELQLPSQWLNTNLLRPPQKNITACHECPDEVLCADSPDFIDLGKCHEMDCERDCLLSEIFNEAETEKFCFQSFCDPEEPTISPRVDINAIYYIRRKRFEITNIILSCQAEDCTQLELFQDVRNKLEKNLRGIDVFIKLNGGKSLVPSLMMMLFLSIFYRI